MSRSDAALLVELAGAARRVGQAGQRRDVAAIQRHRLTKCGIRRRRTPATSAPSCRARSSRRRSRGRRRRGRPGGRSPASGADRGGIVLAAPAVDAARRRILERRPVVGLDQRAGADSAPSRRGPPANSDSRANGAVPSAIADVGQRRGDRAARGCAGVDRRQARQDLAVPSRRSAADRRRRPATSCPAERPTRTSARSTAGPAG